MKQSLFLVLFSLIIPLISSAQQTSLKGCVLVANSKSNTGDFQYVNNAFVSCEHSKATNTDIDGAFELELVDVELGASIAVSIEKDGWQVVNARELSQVILGQKSILIVYMAPKEELAKSQLEFYNVSQAALTLERDSLISSLYSRKTTNDTMSKNLARQIAIESSAKHEIEEQLNRQYVSIKEKLPEHVKAMASVNLDFCSDLYINAYEHMRNGLPRKAIEILNEQEIKKSFQNAQIIFSKGSKMVNDGELLQEIGYRQIDQLISSYDLKATAYLLLFQFENAITQLDKIIEIHETNELDYFQLAEWHRKAGVAYRANGKYERCLEEFNESLKIELEVLGSDHLDIAETYNDLAIAYHDMGELDRSLIYQKKSIHIIKANQPKSSSALAKGYHNLAWTYSDLGNYDKSIELHQLALSILEKTDHTDSLSLAISYSGLGEAYRLKSDFKEALNSHIKSVEISDQIFSKNDPILANNYNNLALVYMNMGEFERGKFYLQKSTEIREQILRPNHPDLSISYNNLGAVCSELNLLEEGLEFQQKALNILENSLEPEHLNIALCCSNIGVTLSGLGKHEESLEFQLRSIQIREITFHPEHPFLAISYGHAGRACYDLNRYEQAIAFHKKDLKITKKAYKNNRTHLSIPYHNLGLSYLKNGDLRKGKRAFKKCDEASLGMSTAYRHWAIYYSMKNRSEKALNNIEMAVELGWNNINWLKTEDGLDNIREEPEFQAILEQLENLSRTP